MELARQALAVIFVFALLGGAVLALRRRPLAAGTGRAWGWLRAAVGAEPVGQRLAVSRVGQVALTPQHVLHVIRVGNLELVLATHPQGCSVVHAEGELAVRGTAVPSAASGAGGGIPSL